MFDKLKGAAQAATEKVKSAADVAGDTVKDVAGATGGALKNAADAAGKSVKSAADSSAEKSIQQALDLMEYAAAQAIDRPAIRQVDVSVTLNLVVGQLSISASFDPEVLAASTVVASDVQVNLVPAEAPVDAGIGDL